MSRITRKFAHFCCISKTGYSANLAQKPLLDHAYAFDLALCRKSFIKAFITEFVLQFGPRSNHFFKHSWSPIRPPLLDEFFTERQIAQGANESFQRHATRKLVFFVGAPDSLHHRSYGFQVIGDQLEGSVGFSPKVFHE